jgi:hypothetical protein
MKRGGYTKDRTKELKFRDSQKMYEEIKNLAVKQETTIAAILRLLITEALGQREINVDTLNVEV